MGLVGVMASCRSLRGHDMVATGGLGAVVCGGGDGPEAIQAELLYLYCIILWAIFDIIRVAI
jgi:hypothetical protein